MSKTIAYEGANGLPQQVDAAHPLPVNATVTATASTVAKATAAAPTYSEGDVAAPLSVDLAGGLRITGTISASSSIKSTAADPSYSEGVTTNPLSSDLAGYQRVKAKQSGTWVIGAGSALIGSTSIDQTTPGTTNAVSATNFPATLTVNSGNKDNSTIRVVEATDAPAQAARGTAATGAAVPSGAIYLGASVAGTLTGLVATANGLKVDVIASAIPTGASTAAKQPALGTAGASSADVISVQGIASGTALPVSGTFWQATQPVSAAALPLPTGAATEASLATVAGFITATVGQVNVKQINGVTTLMGNGATGTGSQRVTLANDNTGIANWGHGATGSAVPTGAQYNGLIASTANPAAATAGNLVGAMADKLGRQVVVVGNVRDLKLDAQLTLTSTTAETTLLAAVASTFLDMYGCIIENISATACEVEFRDDTAGTLRFSIYVPAGDTRGFMLPSSDAYKQATVNKNWTAKCITSVASIKISALFVKNI